MTRRCSYCSHNGHNSRTCPNRGVKLFGVRLTDGSIKKSASMGNLSCYAGSPNHCGLQISNNPESPDATPDNTAAPDGYASEDFVPGSSARDRKKGVPWTEEEHRMFLLGLQKLGKGDWRGISRSFVISRTPTQVASHAQKYFIRQNHASRRKRRSSLFDIVVDEPTGDMDIVYQDPTCNNLQPEADPNDSPQQAAAQGDECESMESTNSNDGELLSLPLDAVTKSFYPVMYPAYFSPCFPFPFTLSSGWDRCEPNNEKHEILKPQPVHSTAPINVDELVGMSRLCLGESAMRQESTNLSNLSNKLLDGSQRPSAFHVRRDPSHSRVRSSSSPIHAV